MLKRQRERKMERGSSSKQEEPVEMAEVKKEDKSYTEVAKVQKKENKVDDNHGFLSNSSPGYRFCPTDSELLKQYLTKKVMSKPLPPNRIHDVNLYNSSPNDLARDFQPWSEHEWYFFTPRDRKYPNGKRPNRAAGGGYWRATGADRKIKEGDDVIGVRKSLVFYNGKPKYGKKTDWKMHEFRIDGLLENTRTRTEANMRLDDCVLCRMYAKKREAKSEDKVMDEKENSFDDHPSASQPELQVFEGDERTETPGVTSGRMYAKKREAKSEDKVMDEKENSFDDHPSASQPELQVFEGDERTETPSVTSGLVILPPSIPELMDSVKSPISNRPEIFSQYNDSQFWSELLSGGDLVNLAFIDQSSSQPETIKDEYVSNPQHNYSQFLHVVMSGGDLGNLDFIDQSGSQPETITDEYLSPFVSYYGQSQYGFIDTNQGSVNNFAAGILPTAGSDNNFMANRLNNDYPVTFNSQLPPADALILNPSPVSQRPFGFIDQNNDMQGGSVRGTITDEYLSPFESYYGQSQYGFINTNQGSVNNFAAGILPTAGSDNNFMANRLNNDYPVTFNSQLSPADALILNPSPVSQRPFGFIDQNNDMQGGSVRGTITDEYLSPFVSYYGQSQYELIDTNQGSVNNFAAGFLPTAGSDNNFMANRLNNDYPVTFNSQLPPADALILNPSPVSQRPFGYIDQNNDMQGGSVRGTRFMDGSSGME